MKKVVMMSTRNQGKYSTYIHRSLLKDLPADMGQMLVNCHPAAVLTDTMSDILKRGDHMYRPTKSQLCMGIVVACEVLDGLHPDELANIEHRYDLKLTDPLDFFRYAMTLAVDGVREINTLHTQEGQRWELGFCAFFKTLLIDLLQQRLS